MSIKPDHKPARRRRFKTYDLEWYPKTLEVRMAGCFDGENFDCYTGPRTIQDFLQGQLVPRNNGMWFFAHAGGLYDFQFLLESLIDGGYRVEAAFSGSSAIICRIEQGGYNWTFIDSYWLMRQPLRKIGEWLGMAKGGAAGETEIFDAPIAELREYNERDCRILFLAISTLEEVLLDLGGQLERTIASSALRLFRRKFLSDEIRTNQAVNELARESYVGSRVEVYARECGEANYWDINSSFPHAMTLPHPGRIIRESKRLPNGGLYLADVEVSVPDMHIPPLPIRPKDGRIYFPTGSWRAWLMNSDIEFALECGARIERCHRSISFEERDDLGAYALTIYALRRDSNDEAYKAILKILLNSLYGKFGESEDKEKMYINPDKETLQRIRKTPGARLDSPGVWVVPEQREIPHAWVPISSHITAHARAALGHYMMQAKDVYYCDTDGFAVDRGSHYESGIELGDLKLEKVITEGRFAAPKLYTLRTTSGDIVKAKGFNRVVRDDGESTPLTYDDFTELLEHKELTLERFSRVKQAIRGDMKPSLTTIQKAYRGTVRPKRCFGPGGESRPWQISELER